MRAAVCREGLHPLPRDLVWCGQRFVLKYEEKSSRDRLPGAELSNEFQVVLLQGAAMRVPLLFQLLADGIQMPVNIRTLCQRLELHLDRSNFQIGNKGVNDARCSLALRSRKLTGITSTTLT